VVAPVASVQEGTLPPAKAVAPIADAPQEGIVEDIAPVADTAEKVAPAPTPVKQEEAQKTPAPSAVASKAPQDSCAKAEEEANRAKGAVSEADQLFYLRRALRLCPNGADYHLQIGKVYSSLGRVEDAEYEFRQAAELDPANAAAKELLAQVQKGSH
jgi:tetratricopeptide (TPR) repeat protein